MYTNHNAEIALLRERGTHADDLASDLLGMHDATSLSLDDWESATAFIENRIHMASPEAKFVLQKNGA